MLMKLRFAILILATMCMSWLAGCDEEDTVMTSQRSAIENYLKTRKLVSRKVAEQSGDTELSRPCMLKGVTKNPL